jgi:hypothetical protein
MGDYKGQTGMSPPTAYPSTIGNEAYEGSSSLDTMSTLSTTTLASMRVIRLCQGPLLEYLSQGRMTNPQVNYEQDYLKVELTTKDKHEHYTPSSIQNVEVQV